LTGLLSLWSVEPPAVFARLSVGQLWDSPLVRLRDTIDSCINDLQLSKRSGVQDVV